MCENKRKNTENFLMFYKGLFSRQIVTFELWIFFYRVYVTLRFIYREKCIFGVRVKNWQPHLARDAQCEYIRCFILLFPLFRYQLKTRTFRERNVYLLHLSGFFFAKACLGINGMSECPRVRFLRIAVLVLFASRALRLYVVLIDERDNNSDSWHDAALIW